MQVAVSAAYGNQVGQPIPNIALRIVNGEDPIQPPPASCNRPKGVVLTDSTGTATCDLLVTGPPGPPSCRSLVGEQQQSFPFDLQITPGTSCSYSLSASNQSFGSTGGSGCR